MPAKSAFLGSVCLFVLLSILSASLSPTSASRVRTLSLEDLTRRSDRVFSGRCVDVRVGRDPALSQTVTRVTFEVERGVKGEARGRVTIKVLGDQSAKDERSPGIDGAPRYAEGEEVILFLYGESRHGLTSPVGFAQGKFSVVRDKQGQRRALNGLGNRHLFEGLSAEAKGRLRDVPDRWKGRDGLPPDALLDLVTRLQP